MDYKKFYKVLVGIVILVLGATAIINYFVDPAMIFYRGKYIAAAGKWLGEGKAVAMPTNTDERLLQKSFIEQRGAADVLVLGSSRAMACSSEVFPGQTLHNGSVSGAQINDLLAIFELYVENHGLPGTVLVEVEPWTFNKNWQDKRFKSISEYYKRGVERVQAAVVVNDNEIVNYDNELISFPYLSSSLKMLSEGRLPTDDGFMITTSTEDIEYYKVLPDGSREWRRSERERTAAEVERLAKADIANKFLYGMNDYKEIDPVQLEKFTAFMQYLMDNNIKVYVWETPLYPATYDALAILDPYSMVTAADKKLKELADTYNYKLIGSYNPRAVGVSEQDFMDAIHLQMPAQVRIMKQAVAAAK